MTTAPAPPQAQAPEWLPTLLSPSTIPTLPLPSTSHNRPAHPHLTSLISDGHFHPALEASLHLANGDLYSAHFLVRKAQGGAKELDWAHAILHRLEGDMGNAKCWYTDLSNLRKSKIYLDFLSSLPQDISPYKFVDLCHFHHLRAAQPKGSIASTVAETTNKFNKIPRQESFSEDQLRDFESGNVDLPLTRKQTEELAVEEIRIIVEGCAREFGWGEYGVQDSVEAFKSQSGVGDEERVSHNAEAMVAGGGSRTF